VGAAEQVRLTMNGLKRCSKCKRELATTEFNKRTAAPDGLQPKCRECSREWHRTNREARNRQIHARQRAIRSTLFDQLREYLLGHPCVDCGQRDLLVLEFDHIGDDKTMNVSKMMRLEERWPRILDEIAKCEVVCANCHRLRTQERTKSVRWYWRSA
jgi:hypothetical protein